MGVAPRAKVPVLPSANSTANSIEPHVFSLLRVRTLFKIKIHEPEDGAENHHCDLTLQMKRDTGRGSDLPKVISLSGVRAAVSAQADSLQGPTPSPSHYRSALQRMLESGQM